MAPPYDCKAACLKYGNQPAFCSKSCPPVKQYYGASNCPTINDANGVSITRQTSCKFNNFTHGTTAPTPVPTAAPTAAPSLVRI
jgi:hypothetical protein